MSAAEVMPLSTDLARLAALEQVIEEGMAAFVAVGTALAEVRDGRLYRAEHATFEAYCEVRWQMSRRRAYQLMEAADVVCTMVHNELVPVASTITNERQARALGAAPADERVDVLATVVANGRPTAAAIEAEISSRSQPEATEEAQQKEEEQVFGHTQPLHPVTAAVEVEERRRQAQAEARKRPKPAVLKGSRHIDPVRCVTVGAESLVGEVESLISMTEEGLTSFDLLLPEQLTRLEKALGTMLKRLAAVPR